MTSGPKVKDSPSPSRATSRPDKQQEWNTRQAMPFYSVNWYSGIHYCNSVPQMADTDQIGLFETTFNKPNSTVYKDGQC